MDAEVSTLSSANLPPALGADDSPSSLETKEPAINGLPHKLQVIEDQVDSSTTRNFDVSAENAGILTFKEDSVVLSNLITIEEEEAAVLYDETPTEIIIKRGSEASKSREEEQIVMDIQEENSKNQEDDDEENIGAEEIGDADDDGDNDVGDQNSSPQKRPKRDIQRRSVFEMLQSEIQDEDDECDNNDVVGRNDDDDVDHHLHPVSEVKKKGRKKRKIQEDVEPALNLEELGDDDDEDFIAEGLQKKSPTKKKNIVAKKEEKNLVLFDDDDLPLKGKRSGGRPKKKKTEEEDFPSEDDWAGRIKGKLFHDDDDDHENDIDHENDDYQYRQQMPSEKKVAIPSNKRSFDGSSKKQTCSKKIKIDVQGWKFSKSRDGMDSKPRSKLSSGPTSTHHQTSGIHSGTSSNTSVQRTSIDNNAGPYSLQEDELRRKQSILTALEQKLRHLDRELEERVAVIRRNEGKILREERRLKEFEAMLNYKQKLLNNCEEFLSGANEDLSERMACMKRDYEKYRGLAEEHKNWIEKEHGKMEERALGRSFVGGENSDDRKEVTGRLPSLEQVQQAEVELTPDNEKEERAVDKDHEMDRASGNPKEVQLDV